VVFALRKNKIARVFVPEDDPEPARKLKKDYKAGEIDVLSHGLIVARAYAW
jgi:hypothetical protein